jgi:zinc protease
LQVPHLRAHLWRGVLAIAVYALCPAPAGAQLHERTLSNGLRIVVKEDRRAPVVISMVWYRAGSMDEVTGTTGVAHVLEHMMFKGTQTVPPGEFSRTIARAGGRDNAFTSKDATAYHQQLDRSQLPLALRLEADRMANLLLDSGEFSREIRVVMEERRLRTEDQPRSLLYEAFLAAAYTAHPYRNPVIGWMQDLRNMSVDDARSWYRTWYAPNNATLVVVGDVDAEAVFSEAGKWFGLIPARPLPQRKDQQEPAQRGTRRVEVSAPAELPYLLLGWHVPVLQDAGDDADAYALWMLSAVLDGGDASRLPRDLVRGERLAVSAGASYDPVNRGPSLFVLSGTPSAGRSVEELEAALRAQLQRVAREGITEDELRRTKLQAVASRVFQRDSMYAQAMDIGSLITAGLPAQFTDEQVRRLQDVTAEQVQAAALKFFSDQGLTVAVLHPLPVGTKSTPRVPESAQPGTEPQ